METSRLSMLTTAGASSSTSRAPLPRHDGLAPRSLKGSGLTQHDLTPGANHYHGVVGGQQLERTDVALTIERDDDDDDDDDDGDEVESPAAAALSLEKDQNCDRRRPKEEDKDESRLSKMSTSLMGKTVAPFLKEHIPGLYAPIGKEENEESTGHKDLNSRYCYRHRPDSKCRRAADETKMSMIQSALDTLPSADQQAISTVWSLFSAAPSKHRELMLQGILTQCCFPQLSMASREVTECLKIDFVTALPVEVAQKILTYLDGASLCRAAQVSRRWRELADDDIVWSTMCSQHIDRKCTKCGWGLPLLERKRLREWTRQRELAAAAAAAHPRFDVDREVPPPVLPAPNTPRSPSPPIKRGPPSTDGMNPAKRPRVDQPRSSQTQVDQLPQRKAKNWKEIYRDRFKIGSNWRYGRCTIKSLRGHTNGVTCLMVDEPLGILATGSYDSTIKIWDLYRGTEIRTLRGHTKGIRSLQLDDSKLISGSLDNTIRIWNWKTGECLSTLRGHDSGVISVRFEGDILVSGSIDTQVKVFNFTTKQTFCLREHKDWVNDVRIDLDSRTVFSASDDMTVKLWDLDTKRCIRTYMGHMSHVQQVLPLPGYEPDDDLDGRRLSGYVESLDGSSVSGGRDSTPALGSSSSQDEDFDLRGAYGAAFIDEPDRPLPPRYFLSGGLDSTIRLFDSATGRCLKVFFGHVEGVWSLAFDTLRVASGANDGMVKIWDPRTGKCEKTWTGHAGPVTCVGLSDSMLASGSEDGSVLLYCFQDTASSAGDQQVSTPATSSS